MLIDFDDLKGDGSPITGDEFTRARGRPVFTGREGITIHVGNPAPGQVPNPPSGTNMLHPPCIPSCKGAIVLDFETAVSALAALFVDVESDFAWTGFSLDPDASQPEVAFSSDQGQGAFGFLGLVSDNPFRTVVIHFATGPSFDGVILDNLEYVLAE